MRIIAADGKEGFISVEACLEYEQQLLRKKEEFEREKNARFEAIEKKQKELLNMITQFEADYGEYIDAPAETFSNMIEHAFRLS